MNLKQNFIFLFLSFYACFFISSNIQAAEPKAKLLAVLPFEQDSGKEAIIIRLKLNNSDKILRFLFDSGANGIAITKKIAEEIGIKATRQQSTSVVGGDMQIQISEGNTVHLDTLKLLDQNIALFDQLREGIDGVIGLNLPYNYIVHVNFDEKEMELYQFGAFEYDKQGKTESISVPSVIHIKGHINIAGKKKVEGTFVFDTGAEYFFMGFSPFVRSNRLLLSGFKHEKQASTTSMGVSTPVYEGTVHEFGVGEHIQRSQMPVSLQASSGNSKWKPNADGSVGIKLISQYNFTINLAKKELHFSPRK